MRKRLGVAWWVGSVLAIFGCSSASESAHPPNLNDEGMVNSRLDAGQDRAPASALDECNEGETKLCSIDLGEHALVHDCITGYQVCESGHWSRCYPN
jgi:hypothetical protein